MVFKRVKAKKQKSPTTSRFPRCASRKIISIDACAPVANDYRQQSSISQLAPLGEPIAVRRNVVQSSWASLQLIRCKLQ